MSDARDQLKMSLDLEARQMEAIRQGYQTVADETAATLAKMQPLMDQGALSRSEVYKFGRLQKVQEQVLGSLDRLHAGEAGRLNDSLAEQFDLGYFFTGFNLEKKAGLSLAYAALDADQLRAAALSPLSKISLESAQEETRRRIRKSIVIATAQGEGISKLGDRIRDDLGQNANDVYRIARTETTRVNNEGCQASFDHAKSRGLPLKKEWISTLDAKTRESHQRMDGEVVELDQRFSNGLMQPGEMGGPPAEVIRCRCTMGAVLAGYEKDNTTRRARSIETGQNEIVKDMPYSEWRKTQINTLSPKKQAAAAAQQAGEAARVAAEAVARRAAEDAAQAAADAAAQAAAKQAAEEEARRQAEEAARLKAEEEARQEAARLKAEEDARIAAEAARKAAEEAARIAAEEAKRQAEEAEAKRKAAEEAALKAEHDDAMDQLMAAHSRRSFFLKEPPKSRAGQEFVTNGFTPQMIRDKAAGINAWVDRKEAEALAAKIAAADARKAAEDAAKKAAANARRRDARAAKKAGQANISSVTNGTFDPADYKSLTHAEARKRAVEFYKNVPQLDVMEGMDEYFGNGNSFQLNAFMYSGNYKQALTRQLAGDYVSTAEKKMMKQIGIMKKTIAKAPGLPEGTRLVRMADIKEVDEYFKQAGLSYSSLSGDLTKLRARASGISFQTTSFTSTSYDISANYFGQRPVQFEIYAKPGLKGQISHRTYDNGATVGEAEIVFDEGTPFTVLDFAETKTKDRWGGTRTATVIKVLMG